MQLKLSTSLVVFAMSLAAVHGSTIVFYDGTSCSGPSGSQFRNPGCNYCYSPPPAAIEGVNSVKVLSISPDQNWRIHTERGCTRDSEEFQSYGPGCFDKGGLPAIRSVFIGCVQNKFGFNGNDTHLIFTGGDSDTENLEVGGK